MSEQAPAQTEGLDALGEALRQRRSEIPASDGTIEPAGNDEYPRTVDMECVCMVPMCGKHFTVPRVFLAPDKPVGGSPRECPDCVAQQQRREHMRIVEDERRVAELSKPQPTDVLAAMEEAGGNPYAFGRWTLDTFPARHEQLPAFRATREFTEAVKDADGKYDVVRGLYLFGPTGTAKSQLLHLVLHACIEAGMKPGRDVIYDDAACLIDEIQDSYNSHTSTYDMKKARFKCRLWLLDDFGLEKATPDAIRSLTSIFNRREGRPTAVTSNLAPHEIQQRHPDYFRLVSRFGPRYFRPVEIRTDTDMRFVQGQGAA